MNDKGPGTCLWQAFLVLFYCAHRCSLLRNSGSRQFCVDHRQGCLKRAWILGGAFLHYICTDCIRFRRMWCKYAPHESIPAVFGTNVVHFCTTSPPLPIMPHLRQLHDRLSMIHRRFTSSLIRRSRWSLLRNSAPLFGEKTAHLIFQRNSETLFPHFAAKFRDYVQIESSSSVHLFIWRFFCPNSVPQFR
jgi:hypothetical protein